MKQKNILFCVKFFPAVTSGLLLTISFPDTGFFWLAFFALVPWFLSLRKLTAKEAFFSGFVAGLIHFITLIYWIVPTVTVYGGLHPILALSTLTLLSLYLALYPALFGFLIRKLSHGTAAWPLLAACLWTGLEYLRTYAFTGFAWGALGYSQYSNLIFIQIADLSGVYGVSFMIVLINCLVTVTWTHRQKKDLKKISIPFAYTLVFLAGILYYGHRQMNLADRLIQRADWTTLSVIQGNIRQDLKWSDAFKAQTIEKYTRISQEAVLDAPDLIIWPETALPFYYGYDKPLSDQVDALVRESKTNYLIGSPAFKAGEKEVRFYNRAYLLNRFSIVTGTYDKHHLVPFGEYVPFGKYLTFLGKITAQAGNFSSGDTRFMPLPFNDHKTGVLICFEILFPATAAKFVRNGADILTTITNDAWFGKTSAAQQHFSIAVFRAVENRRTVARAANTGISGFIDPKGKILGTSLLFTEESLTRAVPALKGLSFYTRYGDLFAVGSIVAFCLAFMVKGIRKIDEEKST